MESVLVSLSFCGAEYRVHPSWVPFLTQRIAVMLDKIGVSIGNDFTPPAEKVLRFLSIDLAEVKVITLGQDPYPQVGVATGRSFEVGNIKKWADLKRNASLVNILKLLHKNYLGEVEISSIIKVREDIENGTFPILPPCELFNHFEKNGVLMLNASLTCQLSNSGSHKEVWEEFSLDLFHFIAENSTDIKWFLWGKAAQALCSFVPAGQKLESGHPRLFSKKSGSFLHENHFAVCSDIPWTP